MKTTRPIKHADACSAATASSVITVTMSARIKRHYQTGAGSAFWVQIWLT